MKQVTTDPAHIRKIITAYFNQFYPYDFNNLDEMDQFLEIHNPQKLTQEETETLTGSFYSEGTESVIRNLPIKRSPRPEGFTGEFY